MKLEQMLEHLGLEFEGRLHRYAVHELCNFEFYGSILTAFIVVLMMQQIFQE